MTNVYPIREYSIVLTPVGGGTVLVYTLKAYNAEDAIAQARLGCDRGWPKYTLTNVAPYERDDSSGERQEGK